LRLWSLHPKYLDRAGLCAAWREALLAQKVLQNRTRGYRCHPQLLRFREQPDPLAAIGAFLEGVLAEAKRRGYSFDAGKIVSSGSGLEMAVSSGQIRFEWEHLKRKLRARDRAAYLALRGIVPEPHPLFRVIEGKIEAWEVVSGRRH
jgi:hypothetical protein